MTKRKCELQHQLLPALLPPCKRPLLCQDSPRVAKRKPEHESAPWRQDNDRVLPPSSPPPCKKPRMAESPAPDYKCQEDEAFPEYNSFQFWRTPLPALDLSEIAAQPSDASSSIAPAVTEVQDEMDS